MNEFIEVKCVERYAFCAVKCPLRGGAPSALSDCEKCEKLAQLDWGSGWECDVRLYCAALGEGESLNDSV